VWKAAAHSTSFDSGHPQPRVYLCPVRSAPHPKHPIAATSISQHHGGPQLGGGEVGERELDENYGLGCRCDHAASSSGRFQSSARARNAAKSVKPPTAKGGYEAGTRARLESVTSRGGDRVAVFADVLLDRIGDGLVGDVSVPIKPGKASPPATLPPVTFGKARRLICAQGNPPRLRLALSRARVSIPR